MPSVRHPLASAAIADRLVAAVAGVPAVSSVTQWLLVCLLCALVYWIVGRRFFGCDRGPRAMLFLALVLVAVAGSMVYAESHAFALQHPLLSLPIQVLFLLFFYIFSDRRFTPTWARWMAIVYVFSELGTLAPAKSPPAQSTTFLPSIPGLLGALGTLSDMIAVTSIVVGILPQMYRRYRNLVAHDEPTRGPHSSSVLTIACAVGSILLLSVSAVFAPSTQSNSSPAYLLLRTAFYLLATLVPVAVAFVLLHVPRLDQLALGRRAAVSGLLTLCLLLIFGVCVAALGLAVPGFAGFSTLGYLPFVMLIAVLLATIFRPLRTQIQDRVDQYIYPACYKARQCIATFRFGMRDGLRLEQLGDQFVAMIQKAFDADALVLWLPSVPSASASASHTPDISLRRLAARGGLAEIGVEIGGTDPLWLHLSAPSRFLAIDRLPADSAATRALAGSAVANLLTFVSQGVLVGVCGLGARSPEQPYTADDAELLMTLADDSAPSLQAAAMAHRRELEARQRERVEQELQTARRIQESLLPKEVPLLDGWHIATRYQPAREVGGDFYDFLTLTDGRLGLVLGDVTDKGIPAALVMATTRSMLRAVAMQPRVTPGEVLAQVNDLLCPDLPSGMFVTCFYAILDPPTGRVTYANAGQDPPFLRRPDGSVGELYATGMPLGLLPAMRYEEREGMVASGEGLLFFSDGLVEAHNPAREMFGLPRLQAVIGNQDSVTPPISALLQELAAFTGAEWEQEDDITLVSVQRVHRPSDDVKDEQPVAQVAASEEAGSGCDTTWRTLATWSVASEPGNEQRVIARVAETLGPVDISAARLEQLKTAVGEAAMNAMEHGNHFAPDKSIALEVLASRTQVAVRVTDEGGQGAIATAAMPDLDAKLAGLQSPRGWGLFLIEHLVDEMHVSGDDTHRTVELVVALNDHGDLVPRS